MDHNPEYCAKYVGDIDSKYDFIQFHDIVGDDNVSQDEAD